MLDERLESERYSPEASKYEVSKACLGHSDKHIQLWIDTLAWSICNSNVVDVLSQGRIAVRMRK